MADGFLQRLDVGTPRVGNQTRHYFVKFFEADTLAQVQTAANEYLHGLEGDPAWVPHLLDSRLSTYTTVAGPPVPMFIITLSIMIIGGEGGTPPAP